MTTNDKKRTPETPKTERIHPLVKFNYLPRIIGFILHGIILISIFYGTPGILLWTIIGVQILIWPHIAYLLGRYSKNPRRAEYRNLYFEAFLSGVWMNLVSFALWPSAVFLIGASMNLLATRGVALFRNAVFFLVVGVGVAGLFNGFRFAPESGIVTAYACIGFLFIYGSIVSFLSFQTSRKLNVSKQRTEAILNAIQSGVLVIDVETRRIIEANPAAAAMCGVSRDDFIGQVCHRFICPAEKGACPIIDKGQQVDNSERVLLDRTGRPIPILKTVVPIVLDGRECLLESFIDISDRKQMEEELRRLARAVEQSIDGIAVADMDGNIQFVNSAWAKMHGYEPDELPGKHIKIFHTHGQLEKDVGPFNAQVIKNGSNEGEVGHVTKDGRPFPTWMTTTLFRDEDGRPVGLLGIARDITDRKQAENELRVTLEKVESVNRDLARQTDLANKMAVKAESANVAKSQFLANMSHEIRTPMNAVVGMSHLLADTEMSDDQRHFVKIIQQSADSLLNVINDILDFSKIEAGKLDLEIIEFDLIRLLDEINSMLEIEARGKQLEYICRIDPTVPSRVSGDPGRIRQVLVNLVGNAIKFTQKGRIEVHVNRYQDVVEDGNQQVRLIFSVIDTGIGIAPEKVKTLFHAFTQADASTTRQFGGTGLGLSIAKTLIEMMGGQMGVSSEPGRGSAFTFSVCLKKAAFSGKKHVDIDAPEASPVNKKNHSAGKHGLKILVAEDFPVNQEVVQGFLENFGFAVCVVENGKQAIKALERDHYDLVLMDVQMPEMDGIEATRIIRDPASKVLNHEIAIVALTGHALAGDRHKYADAGMDDYLAKPVNPTALYEVVARNLSKDRPV